MRSRDADRAGRRAAEWAARDRNVDAACWCRRPRPRSGTGGRALRCPVGEVERVVDPFVALRAEAVVDGLCAAVVRCGLPSQ